MLFVFDLKKHLRLAKLRLLHFSQHYIIENFRFRCACLIKKTAEVFQIDYL